MPASKDPKPCFLLLADFRKPKQRSYNLRAHWQNAECKKANSRGINEIGARIVTAYVLRFELF